MAKKRLDFSAVETFTKAPEGTHVARVASVEESTFQSGNEGFKVAFEITKGAGKGAKVYDNFPLTDTALWKLKTLLEALKIKCDGRIILDTDKMVGKTLEIDVYHEEYEGKNRARISEMRKLSASKSDEEEDDEEDDLEDEDDLEEDEEEEEKPKKVDKKKKKPAKKAKKQVEDEEDEEGGDEEEEEKKPAKKSKKAPAKKTKKKEPEPEDDDDWDDDEWEDE